VSLTTGTGRLKPLRERRLWRSARKVGNWRSLLVRVGKTNSRFPPKNEPAHAAIVEAIYLAEIDMQFDDTRAARVHRKEDAKSKKAKTESEFSLADRFLSPSKVTLLPRSAVSSMPTNAGRVIALIDIFGRMTPVEFEPKQLTPAA